MQRVHAQPPAPLSPSLPSCTHTHICFFRQSHKKGTSYYLPGQYTNVIFEMKRIHKKLEDTSGHSSSGGLSSGSKTLVIELFEQLLDSGITQTLLDLHVRYSLFASLPIHVRARVCFGAHAGTLRYNKHNTGKYHLSAQAFRSFMSHTMARTASSERRTRLRS